LRVPGPVHVCGPVLCGSCVRETLTPLRCAVVGVLLVVCVGVLVVGPIPVDTASSRM